MPRPRLHAEGEQLTVQQIHQRVPVLSERTIRDHLAAGRRTRTAMLCFDPIAAAARGAHHPAHPARPQPRRSRFLTRRHLPHSPGVDSA
jgi:hypothetical protein